jgi:hypothetical protein
MQFDKRFRYNNNNNNNNSTTFEVYTWSNFNYFYVYNGVGYFLVFIRPIGPLKHGFF